MRQIIFCFALILLLTESLAARRFYFFDEIRFGMTQAKQADFVPGFLFSQTNSMYLTRGMAFVVGHEFSWSRQDQEYVYTFAPGNEPLERYSFVNWSIPLMIRKSIWRSGVVAIDAGAFGSVSLFSRKKSNNVIDNGLSPKTDFGLIAAICFFTPAHNNQTCPVFRLAYHQGLRDFSNALFDFHHAYFSLEVGLVF